MLAVSTGTAANALCLAALTPPWGAVLCHLDSHINSDECGAPEFFTGAAKLVPLPGSDAKVDPDQLRAATRRQVGDAHSLQPATLSITQATETGALYTLKEIRQLTGVAKDAGLCVHMDGARFANAVAALGCPPAEMTWRAGVDLLSYGATKNGAVTADVIVVFDHALTTELAFRVKRSGQLASKMRFHTAQLDAYFTDDLWLHNARHANAMAARLTAAIRSIAGVGVLGAAQANIIFCQLSQYIIDRLLGDGYSFYHDRWGSGVVRFVTSFATTADDIDDLVQAIRGLAEKGNTTERP
jgi:threonine aldolase